MGACLLILSFIAIIPGLMEPKELTLVLIVGIIGALIGAVYLFQPNLLKDTKSKKRSRDILREYQKLSCEGIKFTFKESGVFIKEQKAADYEELSKAVFCDDITLLIFGDKLLFLQNNNLKGRETKAFEELLKRVSKARFFELHQQYPF